MSRDRLIAGYAALACVVHVLESALPSPLPGVKPGLANVIVLIVLLRHGLRPAMAVALLRVLVGSLVAGSFLGPAFWLSLSGGVASMGALALGVAWNRLATAAPLSAIGLAVLSALAHMAGQWLAAYTLFVPHPGLLALLPVLMLAALLFGIVTGGATTAILRRMAAPAGAR